MSFFDDVRDTVTDITDPGGFFSPGKPPKATVETKSTLTPEQEAALKALLGQSMADFTSGTMPAVPNTETSPIPLENLSLAALEERVKQIAAGGSPTEQATQQQLMNIIASGGTPTGGQTFEDFFKTNVEQPATESFKQDWAQIGTRFGGNELFSSDRASADSLNQKNFMDSLTRSRGELAFNERKNSLDNLMTALGISSQNMGKIGSELGGIAQVAFGERQFDQTNADNRYRQFLTEQGLKQAQIDNLLAMIRTPAFENIALVSGGQSGTSSTAIQTGGAILAALIAA